MRNGAKFDAWESTANGAGYPKAQKGNVIVHGFRLPGNSRLADGWHHATWSISNDE